MVRRRAIVLISAALVLLMATAPAQCSGESCEDWEAWEDSPEKSSLWEAISQRNTQVVKKILVALPCAAKARAKDGRGPLFWAYEFGAKRLAALLVEAGAEESATDENGFTPAELKSDTFDEDYDEEEDDFDAGDEEPNPYEDYDDEGEDYEDEDEEHEEL